MRERFALALVLGVGLAWPDVGLGQSVGAAPVWPTDVSMTARAKTPIIDTSRALFQRMTQAGWQPARTINVDVRDDNARLNLFCAREFGRVQLNYSHRTSSPDDIVAARVETTACGGQAQGVTDAIVTFRDGSMWVGQVEIQRNRAIPERPRGDSPGALLASNGSVLFSLGRRSYDRVLGENEYRYDGWIHPNGTALMNETSPGYPLRADRDPLISQTQTPYYVSAAARRRSPYRGPPVYFQRGPTGANLILPDGGELAGGYIPSAGLYLAQYVQNLGTAQQASTGRRSIVPITDLTHVEQGYTITGEYSYDFACQPQASPFTLQFEAPMTEDQPVADGSVAGWRCVRFEFIGNTRITTTGRSVLGPAGTYFAPFGSLAVGRGPRLADMIVSTRRHQIVPASGRQHELTPYARSGNPYYSQHIRGGNATDFQNLSIYNSVADYTTGIRQRYEAALAQIDAPVRQQVAAQRAAARRRQDFFFNLSSAAAGAAVAYNQQREQQAINDAAARANVARHMAQDAAARSAVTGGHGRDRGAYEDPQARQVELNRVAAEERAARQQQESAALAAQALRDEQASAAAAARQAEQRRAAEQQAVAARDQRREDIARQEGAATQAPAADTSESGRPLDLYLTVRPAPPPPPEPAPVATPTPSTQSAPRPSSPASPPPPTTGTARPM